MPTTAATMRARRSLLNAEGKTQRGTRPVSKATKAANNAKAGAIGGKASPKLVGHFSDFMRHHYFGPNNHICSKPIEEQARYLKEFLSINLKNAGIDQEVIDLMFDESGR